MSIVKTYLKKPVDGAQKNYENLQSLLRLIDNDDIQLDDEDVANLTLHLSLKEEKNLLMVLNVIANFARNEVNRLVLAKEEIFREVISNISSNDPDLTFQSLRCICNICGENDAGKKMFSLLDGVKIFLAKATDILNTDDDDWNKTICPACSCIQNIIDDSETIQREFLEENGLDILIKFVLKFYQHDVKITTSVLHGIASLTDSDLAIEFIEKHELIKTLLDIINNSSDEIITLVFESFLTAYGGKENTRVLLCKASCVETLNKLISKRANFHEQECSDPVLKMMADLVVMLTSGEESFDILIKEDGEFLRRFSTWIECPNRHIQVSAGLALGNYARSDETCANIVNNKIHENMINVIKENITNESYADRFEAYTSCLRNLTIPVPNKVILIDSGLPQVAVDLVIRSTLPVQFKCLAILRLLVQGNQDLATKLLLDNDLVMKICELSATSVVSSVPSEAQRLMAALVKYSNSEAPIRNAMSRECLVPVLMLLSSDHQLMKNEGLIGLILVLANVNDCLDKLIETECLLKVVQILKDSSSQTQTIYNALTFIQALSGIDGGKVHMESSNVLQVLESLQGHSEDIIRTKVTETIGIMQG